MPRPRALPGWLAALALVLAFVTTARADTLASTASPVLVPVHGTDGVTATLELALDEVVLLRPARPRQAPGRPALVDGTKLLRVAPTSAGIRVIGATTVAELLSRGRALGDVNPEWEIRLVVYTPGVKRSPRTRRLLTDEVAVVKRDGTILTEHATSPLGVLALADALAAGADVQSAAPVTAPSEHLQQRLRRKLAKVQRQDKPDERQQFHARKRLLPGERRIPVDRYFQAREHMRRMPLHSTAAGSLRFPSASELRMSLAAAAPFLGAWTPLGPGNIGGRTRALVIDPNPPHAVYAGGVAGGVWKSTNAATAASGNEGQVTWQPLTDTLLPNLAIASLAIDPTNSMVLYAGTGEGVFNGDAVRGAGIFKTEDGGATWTQLAATATDDFHFVNGVQVLADGTTVLAATGTGLWRSANAGATWARILDTEAVSGCLEIAVSPDGTYVLVSCGTFAQGTVYRSTSAAADAFTAVLGGAVPSGSAGTRDTGMGRTALAIAPSNPSTVYALASSIAGGTFDLGLKAVYRSTDGGLTWAATVTNTSTPVLNRLLLTNAYFATSSCSGSTFFFNQGWYDIVIAVDPTNPNRVWAGGIDLFRSDDGGANWRLASFWWQGASPGSYVHADQHAIVFHPAYDGSSNTMLFAANDGGIFRTTNPHDFTTPDVCGFPDSGVVWTELNNGYGVTQFYHGLPYPGPGGGDTFLGGTQDNGTIRGTVAGGPDGWTTINGGDGGYVAVDPSNPNVVYTELTNLSLQKATDGAADGPLSFTDAVDGITEASGNFTFVAPFTMSPNNSQLLWIGGRRMWRTTNGAGHWVPASATFSGCGSVSAIAVAPGNDNLVLAGTEQGCLKRTTAGLTSGGSTTWSDVSAALPGAYVSSITFDPLDANTVYLTFSTFGVPHVWVSSDGGVSWRNIDGSGDTALPDVPAHTVAVAPGTGTRLYVGTDVGVFSSDGGATWAVENTGFANVITESLAVGQVGGADHLFAFTHGRGVFRVALPQTRQEVAATAAAVTITGSVAPGGTVALDNTVKNVGGTPTPAFVVGFALVPVDAAGAPTDAEIPLSVTRSAGPLAPRAISRETTTIPVPNTIPPGHYRLRVTADPEGAVTDDPNAGDNTVLSNTFTLAVPDLTVASLTVTPSIVDVGLSITVSHTIRNLAEPAAHAPASQSAVYLATGKDFATVVGGPIAAIDMPAVNALAISPTVTRTITVPMTTGPGRYVVFVKANDSGAIAELDTLNNTRGSTTTLAIGPDLVVSAAGATPSTLLPGGTLAIAHSVKNQGATTTASFAVAFALVPVADPSGASDIPLTASRTVTGLALNGTSAATTSAVVPPGTPRGQYRIRVTVDAGGAVSEASETNNTLLTARVVTVARPDLIVPTVAAPPAVKTATAFAVSNSVKNSSPLPAPGPFTVSLFLSSDTTVDGGDIPLGSRTITTLAANGTSTASTSVTIPDGTPIGVYRILVQADSSEAVVEDDDANNTGASAPVVLGPDLVVTAAGVSPTTIAPGGTIRVSNTVKNQGATAVGTTTLVGFFLSSDATLDGGDVPIAVARSVPPLAAGASSAAATTVTIPPGTTPGIYRILVVADVDHTLGEGDEGNNGLASVAITVALPDLLVPAVTAPAAIKTATRFSVVNTVKNTAAVAAPGPFTVSLFLSTDTTVDGGDIPLGSRIVATLAARGTSRASTPVTVPDGTPIGVYRVLVQADSALVVVESDDENNTGASGPVVLGPDLVVTTARTTPTTVAIAPGGSVTVAEAVKNQGAVATGGASLVGFFLSGDPTLDPTDSPIGLSRAVASLGPGLTSSGTTSVTIPPSTVPGSYFILVVADVTEAVAEGGETNNVVAIPISVTLPDLTVAAITVPPAVRTGTGFAIGTTVKNEAPVAAPGPFTVSLFLSTDETLDGGDIPLGTRTVGPLAANATSSATTTVVVPPGTPVNVYRVLVQVDSGAVVVESVEDNLGVSAPVNLGPELMVSTLTVPAAAIAGRSIAVGSTVKNTGAGDAAGFRVGLYLSPDGTIDPLGDTLVASRSVAGLRAGVSSAASTTVAVPAAMGDYTIGAVADDLAAVAEASELNNVTARPLAVVPDLVLPTDVIAFINFSVSGACGAVGFGNTNLRLTTQTAGAFSGGRLVFFDSLGGKNTISFSGTVSSAGAIAGTVTFSRSGGGGGSGRGTLSGTATDAGDLVLDIAGTINVSGVGACPTTAHVEYHPGP